MTATGTANLAGSTSLLPPRRSARDVVASIVKHKATIRQERLSGIHNPWGHCASLADPWAFLDLCESDLVLGPARKLLGSDIILWDSELFTETSLYSTFLQQTGEGRFWPVNPLAGAVVLLPLGREACEAKGVLLASIGPATLDVFDPHELLYVVRLIPATSRFERDPGHPAHRACMEEQVLVNYANRPLWLLSGVDKANNDLVTGFTPIVPMWASGLLGQNEEK
ncbi:MAG: resolvase [Pseudomonadota bacterium]